MTATRALSTRENMVRIGSAAPNAFQAGAKHVEPVSVSGLNMSTAKNTSSNYNESTPRASEAERQTPDAPKSVEIYKESHDEMSTDVYLKVRTNEGGYMDGTIYSREHVTVDRERTSKSLEVISKDSHTRFAPGKNALIKDHLGLGGKINSNANGDVYKNQTYDIGHKGKYYPLDTLLRQHQVITNGIPFPNTIEIIKP